MIVFDPVNYIADWLRTILTGLGLSKGLIDVLLIILGILVLATFLLVVDIFLVWLERKFVARFQDRFGPNRLGPYGLIQPIADIIKLFIKEHITPEGADKVVFNLPPIIAMATVLLLWAVIPMAPTILGTDINVAVLYLVAIGGISTLGIIMAGWSSNNKYALVSAFRTVAQIVSYEVPMVVALLVPVILAGSMGMKAIVDAQNIWYVILSPLAALIFLITSVAELGRAPFDLTEAESELVAGYHIEYTGMKFGFFYAGELLHALTVSAVTATLFLGGWRGPFVEQIPILGVVYLFAKSFLVYFVIVWLKYSLPRLRIDQMLDFCWKVLTPLSLGLLIVTAILNKILQGTTLPVYVIGHLAGNIFVGWVALQLLSRYGRRERKRVAEVRPIATSPIRDFEEAFAEE